MPIIIERQGGIPKDPAAQMLFGLESLKAILAYLKALVTLDFDTRQVRSELAERALVFVSSAVGAAVPVTLAALHPPVVNSLFTTALIQFDTTSGTGRWRIDGSPPTSLAAPAGGMPIAAGGAELLIVGALNIRSFQVIAEPAQTLNMSVTLFQ